MPRLEARFASQVDADEWEGYVHRLKRHFPRLFGGLHGLYGQQYDFFFHLESILASATEMWIARPAELKALDALRETDPYWYQSHRMVGAMCYVDLFAGDLNKLRERIPYLSELGVNYLHLMPLFETPAGDNDGGYAVSSYREVDPEIGIMEDLSLLAAELRHHGMSLCLDFVNTVGDRPRREADQLHGYGDLVAWGLQAGQLTIAERAGLKDEAGRRPDQAQESFDRAIALREALYGVFAAAAADSTPAEEDLSCINVHLSEALRHELAGSPVGVTVVHPGGVNTNIARNARDPRNLDAATREEGLAAVQKLLRLPPDDAGEIIARGIETRAPRVLVGGDARMIDAIQRLAPARYWSVLSRVFRG